MHIKGNMLYADSFIDLVWFDISDPAAPVLKGRKRVFQKRFHPLKITTGVTMLRRWIGKMGLSWVGKWWKRKSLLATIIPGGIGVGVGAKS